uniref:exodeoxyribonuclease III n=1 Tax=Anolis carolinensis TaxID=28377 RepID=A0A803STM2_ANOCA
MSSKLKIVTLNVRGLGTICKTKRIGNLLKKEQAHIIYLQETHQKRGGLNEIKANWIKDYEKAYGSSKSRGVAVIITNKCNFEIKSVKKDDEGRYIIIEGEIGGDKYVLVNVYAPNENQGEFYEKILGEIKNWQQHFVIVGGDFNMPMDRMKDKSNPTVKDKNNNITELNRIMNKWGLKDSWRLLKGDERKYTYYSAVHKTYTRIDYLFISKNMVDKLFNSEIGIIRISDHAIVNLEIINKQDYEQTRRWRLNSNILNYEEIIRRIGANWQEIWDINDNNVSRNILWDTMKAVARGLCIKETYNLKKRQEERKNKLEKDIEKLEKQYIIKRTTQIYNELRAKKEELDKIEIDEVQKNLIYLKREFFEYSNKNSKMLARAAQKKKNEK